MKQKSIISEACFASDNFAQDNSPVILKASLAPLLQESYRRKQNGNQLLKKKKKKKKGLNNRKERQKINSLKIKRWVNQILTKKIVKRGAKLTRFCIVINALHRRK